MKARDLDLPFQRMRSKVKGGKLAREERKTAEHLEENHIVREWLQGKGLDDQIVHVLYPRRDP